MRKPGTMPYNILGRLWNKLMGRPAVRVVTIGSPKAIDETITHIARTQNRARTVSHALPVPVNWVWKFLMGRPRCYGFHHLKKAEVQEGLGTIPPGPQHR